MAEFEVYLEKLPVYAENQRIAATKLGNLQIQLNSCMLKLDQQLHSELYPEIKGRLQALCERLGRDAVMAVKMADTLDEICNLYQNTEGKITGHRVIQGKINLPGGGNTAPESHDPALIDELLNLFGLQKDAKGITKLIEMLSKVIKEHDGESLGGLAGPYVSYLETLFSFYNGGDIEDFLKLGEKSASFWNAWYGVLDKKYEFGKCMPYGGHMANLSSEISIFGSVFGLFSAYAKALDTEGKSRGEIGSDYIEAGGKVGDVIKAFFKAGGGEVAKNGGWFTLADMGIGTLAQIFESASDYSEDGTFDFDDLNETAVDASTAGLTKLVKGLTIGIVDLDEDYISDVLKNGAIDKGTAVGNYINQNPQLRDMAVNGNIFQQILAYSYAFRCS